MTYGGECDCDVTLPRPSLDTLYSKEYLLHTLNLVRHLFLVSLVNPEVWRFGVLAKVRIPPLTTTILRKLRNTRIIHTPKDATIFLLIIRRHYLALEGTIRSIAF